jgi:hypothetical protein
VDARLHHLQGQAELVTPVELLETFYRETQELYLVRQRNAQSVTAYEANNAYQQVIGRQEVHLQWVADAINALGATPPPAPDEAPAADTRRGRATPLVEADARSQAAFIERWTPRVADVTNARDGKMLALILGEMKEHLRMLQQAVEGRRDVLGRHSDGKVTRGEVMAVRPKN